MNHLSFSSDCTFKKIILIFVVNVNHPLTHISVTKNQNGDYFALLFSGKITLILTASKVLIPHRLWHIWTLCFINNKAVYWNYFIRLCMKHSYILHYCFGYRHGRIFSRHIQNPHGQAVTNISVFNLYSYPELKSGLFFLSHKKLSKRILPVSRAGKLAANRFCICKQ
jgi:hypothetical protein